MKHFKLWLASSLIVFLLVPSGLIKAEIDQATIDYLSGENQNAWITQALFAAGQVNLNIDYVSEAQIASATDAAKIVLALISAGENPYSYNGENYVGMLLGYFSGGQFGSADLINDDFWSVIALTAAGENGQAGVVAESVNVILGAQNDDGGWSWATEGGDSDTNDTSAAIMALIAASRRPDSQETQAAAAYLRANQNDDGGFGFSAGSESDSGSDAWVICTLNSLGLDASLWSVNGQNPLTHLSSLKNNDGSYKWLTSDGNGNLLMTAYATVALSGKFFPVAIYSPAEDVLIHGLRIEGKSRTICNAQVEGRTVQEVLENGAEVCGYDYDIQSTDWGPYLNAINDDSAEGMLGWLYLVNWLSPMVGMADYVLETGDEVLFYYGSWNDQPLRLSLSAYEADEGEQITATVEYFNDSSWNYLSDAVIKAGQNEYQTDDNGRAVIIAPADGRYQVSAEAENKIRSAKSILTVGTGGGNGISLIANIGSGQNEEEDNKDGQVAFSVNISSLDFGDLRPGASESRQFRVTNESEADIYLEAGVSGDRLFSDNLFLNGSIWENYQADLPTEQAVNISAGLNVPQNFKAGRYSADLVLWAVVK